MTVVFAAVLLFQLFVPVGASWSGFYGRGGIPLCAPTSTPENVKSSSQVSYSFEEKRVYFYRFVEQFFGSLTIHEIIPALSLLLRRLPQRSGPWIAVDIGANDGSLSTVIAETTRHGVFAGARPRDDPHSNLRNRKLGGIVAVEAVCPRVARPVNNSIF